jgi:hypothetical protein
MGPFDTIDSEYKSHGQEIRSFGPFSLQIGNIRYNHRLTPSDFEQKIDFLKPIKSHIWDH